MHITLRTVLLFMLVFNTTLLLGQKQEKNDPPQTITELRTAIEKVLDETKTPAVGLALVSRDSAVWIASLGKSNIEKNSVATENTMFRIGSTSKMFVSLAILKLQEEGRVNLKDRVRDLVPEIEFKNSWEDTAPVLVEQLLEHTTGWDDLHLTEYALNEPKFSLKDGLDFHPHSRTSRWVPGTRMAYCNSGPAVAAYIVEKISGQRFEDYIQENFFEPMGMQTATYFESETYKQLGATLYSDGKPENYWNIIMRPAGAINASPKDMAKMIKFFISRGRVDSIRLISEASLNRMETPASSIGAKAGLEYGYGLSNYTSPHENFMYRSHNGGVNGGLSDFSYLPTHNVGYAVMINAGNSSAMRRIVNLVREFQVKDLVPEKIEVSEPMNNQEDISGYYSAINSRSQLFFFFERIASVQHVWHKGDALFSRNLLGGPTEKYVQKNENQFTSIKTGRISLVQVEDPLAGRVIHISNHAGPRVFMPISPWIVFGQLTILVLWILWTVSATIFAVVWSIRYWMGELSGGANIWVRLYPVISGLLFLAIIVTVIIATASDPLKVLGNVSAISLLLCALTFFFALTSAWSVVYITKMRHVKMNRVVYWYSATLSTLHLLVTCYLLWHGVIGIQTWS
jgi:CubicO group peptidase (beta-lactamase class C family)